MPALIDDGAPGSLVLPDGRSIEFAIRYSTRARSARLRVGAREGLVVVVPAGLQRERVQQLVASKRDWIASKLDEIAAIRHLIPQVAPAHPQAFDLPALAETWRVEYHEARRATVGARTDQQFSFQTSAKRLLAEVGTRGLADLGDEAGGRLRLF